MIGTEARTLGYKTTTCILLKIILSNYTTCIMWQYSDENYSCNPRYHTATCMLPEKKLVQFYEPALFDKPFIFRQIPVVLEYYFSIWIWIFIFTSPSRVLVFSDMFSIILLSWYLWNTVWCSNIFGFLSSISKCFINLNSQLALTKHYKIGPFLDNQTQTVF